MPAPPSFSLKSLSLPSAVGLNSHFRSVLDPGDPLSSFFTSLCCYIPESGHQISERLSAAHHCTIFLEVSKLDFKAKVFLLFPPSNKNKSLQIFKLYFCQHIFNNSFISKLVVICSSISFSLKAKALNAFSYFLVFFIAQNNLLHW